MTAGLKRTRVEICCVFTRGVGWGGGGGVGIKREEFNKPFSYKLQPVYFFNEKVHDKAFQPGLSYKHVIAFYVPARSNLNPG